MQLVMVKDFLDTEINGVFTTLCVEGNECIMLHNSTKTRVRLLAMDQQIIAQLFTLQHGWIEVENMLVMGVPNLVPLQLAMPNDVKNAMEKECSVAEFQRFTGFLFLKKLAVILGENPELLDVISMATIIE
ncbi:MAG: hypothetical protein MJ247_00050 [Alphaproteobacteria bacterium]|nr:hypothetical protein [Alphaproteobacteria bacterium]